MQQSEGDEKQLAYNHHHRNNKVHEPLVLKPGYFRHVVIYEVIRDGAALQGSQNLRLMVLAPLLHVYTEFVIVFHAFLKKGLLAAFEDLSRFQLHSGVLRADQLDAYIDYETG